MDNDFEPELKGSSIEALGAKTQIAKYFKRYGDSGHQEARKHQLTFASKIMCAIIKCENRHLDIYCSIITDIFATHLCPEASAKYWTLYVDAVRYFHYILVDKKDFENASLVYRHISSYKNKFQTNENSLTYINIYCYQLFLQYFLKSNNPELAIREATDVVENLAKIFNEILDTNIKLKFQYPNVLNKTMSWLFPQTKTGSVYQFLKTLPQVKVNAMFQSLFTLYGRQTIDITTANENSIQEHAKSIIETIYTLLQVDIMDKMQLQLCVQLLSNCRTETRVQNSKPIAKSFELLHDYFKLICAQTSTVDFQHIYITCCVRFKEFFEKYSKSIINQQWFGDFIVLIFNLHSQLQNSSIYSCFWKQMSKPVCFKSMFQFFVEIMKLAPCISAETKLFKTYCCASKRKHIILSFVQITLASFALYCQNVNEDDEKPQDMENCDSNLSDNYNETIQNNIILIVNHAFKIIDKMDCITSKSQEIGIILTRFKQAALNCKTSKQAGTCTLICELFLKIKTKIANEEWPLLLRRLYKTVTPLVTDCQHIGREIQMCYITSLLHDSLGQIDINQIRTQISIFYATETTSSTNRNEQQKQHEHCLLHIYFTTTLSLRSHLEPSRKKLLHWLESQHILKYYKSNTALLHSILKCSQSHYDFVLITKLAKLQTYAMAKISSMYNNFKTKAALSRLEQLTFGHVCVMLLNDANANEKFQVDSKDLNEDYLENLFMRKEISSINIYNDLNRFNLALEGLRAFENFYVKFDTEAISMDDVIIDWESLLDDLGSLALYLQLSGYMEYSSQAWCLHYKCSRLVKDDFSALRGLAFFCEYSEYFDENSADGHIKIEEEIQYNFPNITQGLTNLANLQRNTYKNYILLAVLQIAYYYARSSRFSYAQILLQYVQQKHVELSERQGRYDIILATMDAIKFRLLWKHCDDSSDAVEENAARTTAENLLLHRCLLHEAEETLDRYHDFSCFSSCDGVMYSILIINLVQEFAECSANRLCDNFINPLFIAACKCTLLLGLSLRLVEVMSMWMWVNLQMECVDKAQLKLKIIEYVLGMKSLNEITEKYKKPQSVIQSRTVLPSTCSELLTPSNHNPGMETIRRLAQSQLSPITEKLLLSPSNHNTNLRRYFNCNIDSKIMPQNEQLEWTFFIVGCLNARLYFLAENYDQLEAFYEKGTNWLQARKNNFNQRYYKNMQLMALQHYANFLRAQENYDKALQYLEYGIKLCETKKLCVDAVYYVNFQLQLLATRKEMSGREQLKVNLPTHSKLRRALQFNISPESKQPDSKEAPKRELKDNMLKNVMASGKKSSALVKSLPIYATDSGCSSSKKLKTQAGTGCSGTNSSGNSSSLDSKSIKQKGKFKICEDSIKIMEVINNMDDVNISEDTKSIKRSKSMEENVQVYKTPKVVRKTTKSSKTTTKKITAKNQRPEHKLHFDVEINLIDSPSPTKSSISPSLENLDAKENLNTNELIAKFQNLEIKNSKKTNTLSIEKETKTMKNRRKPDSIAQPATVVIVLDDSPCTVQPSQMDFVDKTKSSRSRVGQSANEDNLVTSSRTRRQRKLIIENNGQQDLQNNPPLTWSTTATPSATKKRQKNLV